MDKNLSAEFSISATTRKPRKNEKNGIDYHFISVDSFKKKIKNKDFIEFDGEQGAKAQGKWRSEGSDYEVKDGDIILFRFNV